MEMAVQLIVKLRKVMFAQEEQIIAPMLAEKYVETEEEYYRLVMTVILRMVMVVLQHVL